MHSDNLPLRATIVGFGGIGRAIATALAQQGYLTQVISRKAHPEVDRSIQLDVSDGASIQTIAQYLNPLPDLLVVTCGQLSSAASAPEKSIAHCEADWLFDSVRSNVLPTLHVSQALHSLLSRKKHTRLVIFSARVSSISDNHLGGWHSYRMSKSMLNMLIKNIAIEWQHRSPDSWIVGYHPGTVDTALSSPFITNVPPEKRFSPVKAANYFINVLNKLEERQRQSDLTFSGQLFDWQAQVIEP